MTRKASIKSKHIISKLYVTIYTVLSFALIGCNSEDKKGLNTDLFSEKHADSTGVFFRNKVKDSTDLNILKYLYFYNGGGVSVGDVNGDGLPDIYFTSNKGPNKLYLNKGEFEFKDVTKEAGVAGTSDWTTGVTMVDVNGDGYLDIYVSAVDGYQGLESTNQLFINSGGGEDRIPEFSDKAEKFGLDVKGYSTQAAFFDYDLDGDLDVYLLNHSVHEESTFGPAKLREKRHPRAGDRLLENKNGNFVDVSEEAGIYGGRTGYGLGVIVSHFNVDGCPDIYVANDFHGDDYLYLNNCDGTFEETLRSSVGHTSLSSMGVDAADVNNDGRPDLVVLDMLPDDEAIRKTSAGPERLSEYRLKRRYGYYAQYTQNTLQLNQGRGKFSEIGHLAGIAATDWSWAPLIADYNLDGRKDLYITNGIFNRPNDHDYVKYASRPEVQRRAEASISKERLRKHLRRMPQVPTSNYAFRNDSTKFGFENVTKKWGLKKKSFSNGAAYADLDRDGDLDLITNNVNSRASIYENRATDITANNYLRVALRGRTDNTYGIGARVVLHNGDTRQTQELMPTRGYQSSVEPLLVFGLGSCTTIDSVSITWPDGRTEIRSDITSNQTLTFDQANGVSKQASTVSPASSGKTFFTDVSNAPQIPYRHRETEPIDFTREPLIPHSLSLEGPAFAVADVNQDGLDDFFIGGGKRQPGRLYVQRSNAKFDTLSSETWRNDSIHEDVDAAFFDADGDGDQDLYVVSAGNEYWGDADPLRDRLYLNDGSGNFHHSEGALPQHMYTNGANVTPGDYDDDGDIDLFVGGRVVAKQYGKTPNSYLLRNDGSGNYSDVTNEVAPELRNVGMVTDAVWADATGDGKTDLVVVGEWMPITIFENRNGRFRKLSRGTGLAQTEGWWNTIEPIDGDGDGDTDFVAGNLGLNSTLKASPEQPVRLYINDFDDDSALEPILTRYRNGKSTPIGGRGRLAEQLNFIEEKFPTYESLGARSLDEIVPVGKVRSATVREAHTFASTYFENQGDGTFTSHPLPTRAQFAPVYDVWGYDVTGNGHKDLVLGGNFHGTAPAQGRYDASYGIFLRGDSSGDWTSLPPSSSGLYLHGQVRSLSSLRASGGNLLLIAARNDASPQILRVLKAESPTVE